MSESHEITRRIFLRGAGATVSAAALGAAIVPTVAAEEVCGLPLDPTARFEAAAVEYKAAAKALYPDIERWGEGTDGAVFLFAVPRSKPVLFSGYGAYELSIGKTSPIVALAPSENGLGYFWQHYWRDQDGKDRFAGKVRLIKTADLVIKRKIRPLA